MKYCLRMAVEGALTELFNIHGLNLQNQCVQLIQQWKNENYLGMVQSGSLMIEEFHDNAFALLLFVEIRAVALLDAVVEHLENRLQFDLAVIFHQHSGGDRCHLRDLRIQILADRLD